MLFLSLVVSSFFLANLAMGLAVEKDSLRTEGLHLPNSLDTTTPTLSWRLSNGFRGESQSAYQIQAATTPSDYSLPGLWDSGKVRSSNSSAQYSGKFLASRSVVYWRVRVWNNKDVASPWTALTSFEVGLLQSSDWSAQWVTNPAFELSLTSLPYFAKEFQVDCPVSKARLYAVGLGLHSVLINGKTVTDEVLAPGYSNWNKTLIYSTYDISQKIVEGANVVGIELGRGLWDTEANRGGRYTKILTAASPLILIAQLEYSCYDGSTHVVVSDSTWKTSVDGPLLESGWYGGEEYVATKEIPNWSSPRGNRTLWSNTTITTGPSGTLQSPKYPPLKIMERIQPVNISGPISGQYIIDFGVNFAGWYSFNVKEFNGTRITIWPCERLKSNGGLDTSTTGSPIYDAFTSAGIAQIYTPKFAYHGFRYLAVNSTSQPSLSDFEGLIIRASVDSVGTVQTSDDMLNNIHRIIDRSIQSNLYSVMTDCPHREKLGWLEQTHIVFEPITRGYDIQAYGRGIVQTILDSQSSTGLVPDIAPEFVVFSAGFRDDPNWGNALILLPLFLYQAYGDISVLETSYDQMQAYVEFLESKTSNSILAYGLGDWIAFDTTTPYGITATFGYYQALDGLQKIASALGKTSDAAKYAAAITTLLSAFEAAFASSANGVPYYGSGSQASNAIALDIGVVAPKNQTAVVQNVVNAIINNTNHFSVGEIALPALFRILRANGENDIVYKMMTNPTSPSYAYQVLHGATSLTERWDGPTASCSGCNSLNHFMLGYADQWIFELSGLSQVEGSVAWKQINYEPIFVTNLTSASSTYNTNQGWASASWERTFNQFVYNIVVPVGSSGIVTLDLTELGATTLKENGMILSKSKTGNGINSVTSNNGTVVVEVGSGSYNFTANYK